MASKDWEITCDRFVLFFDILGFKDLVSKNSHNTILNKLKSFKEDLNKLEASGQHFGDFEKDDEGTPMDDNQTRSITFSDSIIVFSQGNTYNDAIKILFDAYFIYSAALNKGIAIKGAISFGKITVDFKQSLFFGQPIIDAYLLHEELLLLSIIVDHNYENRIDTLKKHYWFADLITTYKCPLKSGRITHKLFRPSSSETTKEIISNVEKLSRSTSGRPRLYIDNTLDYLNSFPTIAD